MISFKIQNFSHAGAHSRYLRVVLSVLHQSALLLLVFWHFLAWRECYLLSAGRMLTGSSLGGERTGQ